MEQRGILQSWNDDKGFGFIQPEDGSERVFVHISVMRGDARPSQGDAVLYLSAVNEQGRLRATHMRSESLSLDRPAIRRNPREPSRRKAEKSPRSAARRRQQGAGIQHRWPKLLVWLALCSLPLVGVLTLYTQQGWMLPLALYLGVSLWSFFLYRGDKQRAQQSRQRTPENLLHLSELLGGWPGALIAQQVYRHKTRKAAYQSIFWLIVVTHQLFWVDWLLLDGRFLGPLLG